MSQARTYTPQANSLPSLVVGFFTNNPEEELTLDDIADKFGGTRNNIHTNLALATQHELLVRDRNTEGDYIYRAGAALNGKSKGINMDAVYARKTKAPQQVAPAVLPKAEDVQIDSNVPLVSTRGKPQHDWAPLLARLQPDQSAQLPLAAKSTLAKAIAAAHKAKMGTYTMRTFPDSQTLRVWRTE